jgi:hypothetical protein
VEAQIAGARKSSRRNTFEKPVVRNMALQEAAKRVAGEFKYSGEDIRKGVKEFLREMGGFFPS